MAVAVLVAPAREELGRLAAAPQPGEEGAGGWAVARQEVDYVEQMAWLTEPYMGYTAPLRVGTTSVTLGCEIVDPRDASVRIRSRTVLVRTGADSRPAPLPSSTARAMRARLVAD